MRTPIANVGRSTFSPSGNEAFQVGAIARMHTNEIERSMTKVGASLNRFGGVAASSAVGSSKICSSALLMAFLRRVDALAQHELQG